MSRVSPARAVAMTTLERVAEDDAYAAAALDAGIRRASLDARDAALATEIVYGTLRSVPDLDAAVDAYLARGGRRVDGALRAALRAGAYQIRHLDRVPVHAAVSDAVGWVRSRRGPRLAGVANAVLRKVAAARPDQPAPPTTMALPEWVGRAFGDPADPRVAARIAAFAAGRRLPPPVGLRVSADRDPDAVVHALRAARPEAEVARGEAAARSILVRGAGDPRALPGWADGAFAIQEEGAQVVAELVEAAPGHHVLDACAGRGGKSAALAEAVGVGGRVVAVDLHESKLERVPLELERLGLDGVALETRAVDLTVGAGGLPGAGFDRVLVDAPCTGLGTVHRRPEILLRMDEEAPARLAATQLAILEATVPLVRPGGLLVYAVCSPTTAEGPDVAARLEAGAAGAGLTRLLRSASDRLAPDPDGVVRIGPWSATGDTGPDAYQVVRWRRIGD